MDLGSRRPCVSNSSVPWSLLRGRPSFCRLHVGVAAAAADSAAPPGGLEGRLAGRLSPRHCRGARWQRGRHQHLPRQRASFCPRCCEPAAAGWGDPGATKAFAGIGKRLALAAIVCDGRRSAPAAGSCAGSGLESATDTRGQPAAAFEGSVTDAAGAAGASAGACAIESTVTHARGAAGSEAASQTASHIAGPGGAAVSSSAAVQLAPAEETASEPAGAAAEVAGAVAALAFSE